MNRHRSLKMLKITLGEVLEFNRQDAIELAGSIYQEKNGYIGVKRKQSEK